MFRRNPDHIFFGTTACNVKTLTNYWEKPYADPIQNWGPYKTCIPIQRPDHKPYGFDQELGWAFLGVSRSLSRPSVGNRFKNRNPYREPCWELCYCFKNPCQKILEPCREPCQVPYCREPYYPTFVGTLFENPVGNPVWEPCLKTPLVTLLRTLSGTCVGHSVGISVTTLSGGTLLRTVFGAVLGFLLGTLL